MTTTQKFPTPPWDMDIAAERLKFEKAAWNSHDIDRISGGYASGIEMRDGLSFIKGKQELSEFIKAKLKNQQGYTLKLDLWGALKSRMAVRFEAEWHDGSGQWHRSYGVQVFQFDEHGLVEQRYASQETTSINGADLLLG